jgi:hypothetical protein
MDVADLYLESRRRANAVNTDEWTAIEDAGMDPGDALFDTPVYDKIEKRIVGNRLQHVGIGNDDAEGEAILMEEDAPADTVPAPTDAVHTSTIDPQTGKSVVSLPIPMGAGAGRDAAIEQPGIISQFGDFANTVFTTIGDLPDALIRGIFKGGAEAVHAFGLLDDDQIAKVREAAKFSRGLVEKEGVNPIVSGLVEDISAIAAPAIPIFRGLQALGLARGAAIIIAEGLGDALGTNPDDPALANMLQDMIGEDGEGVLTETLKILATDPNDPEIINRARRFAEGAGIGLAFEGIIKAIQKSPGTIAAMKQRWAEGRSPISVGGSIEDVSGGPVLPPAGGVTPAGGEIIPPGKFTEYDVIVEDTGPAGNVVMAKKRVSASSPEEAIAKVEQEGSFKTEVIDPDTGRSEIIDVNVSGISNDPVGFVQAQPVFGQRASAPDIELPPLNTFIKLPRRKSIRPTDSEMGIIQTIASTPEEAQLAVDTIARIRGNYPIGTSKDKFMDIEVTGGKFEDGEFIPKIREQAYAFAKRPEGVSPKQWQTKIANSMVTDVRKVVDRANAGDATAIKILAEARWYRDMKVRLRTEFGGLGDIFADLLGATSAQTNVKANFANAQEILRRFTRGEFDGEIAAWEARKASGESMNPTLLQQLHKAGEFTLITNAAGKLFNSNSPASMKALLDTFRDIKKGVSPKTPNFVTNLIGYRHDATIDVWAGRYIRNKAGLPYIPPAAEKAVSGQHLTGSTMDNPRIGAEFGFGQGVFGEAVGKLNKSGVVKNYDPSIGDMGADDLQAVVWFMEKEKWTKNGWTTKAGEGGSLDYEASLAGAADQSQVETLRGQATATFKPPARRKKETAAEYDQRVQEARSIHGIRVRSAERGVEEIAAPLERTVLGVSGERPGKIPSNYEQAEIAAEFDDVLRNDSSVTAYKATSTIGRFAGKSERALDVEIITRQNFDPAPLKKRLVEVGIDKDQDAVFISKVIVDPKPEQKVNPGLEMYFSRKKKEQFVQDLSEELRKRGIDGFTYITDARQADRINVQAVAGGADTASLTGIRIQYIPEFDSAPSAARRQEMEDIFDDLVEEYGKRGDISSANTVYYETEVFRRATGTGWMSGGQTYDEYLGK